MKQQWMNDLNKKIIANQGMRQYAGVAEFGTVKEAQPAKKASLSKARTAWRKQNKKSIPRGFHIHHIDGNQFNNEANNLVCLSLEQHINIHQIQGDTGAVSLLLGQFRNNYRRQK